MVFIDWRYPGFISIFCVAVLTAGIQEILNYFVLEVIRCVVAIGNVSIL